MKPRIYEQKFEKPGGAAAKYMAPEGLSGFSIGGLSIEEAARYIGIGRSLLFDEIKAGRLIARKVGRRTIITHADALAYLQSRPLAGSSTI